MADFLLVHGSCHGAWCWRDLIPELVALGHSARAIDMPSHGEDETPIADVTLEGCRDAVLAASTPETVIVGHSWGGYPITAAAEAKPDMMRGLIYLCAYVPISGLSISEMRKRADRQPLIGSVVKSPDGLSYEIEPSRIRPLFYHDCSDECVDYARARLCPQAIGPQETPLFLTERYGRVPRAYIRTTDDRTIPPEFQAEMCRDFPGDRRYDMDSSHSPFFSHPRQLAQLLSKIERQF